MGARSKCDTCIKELSEEMRQLQGCGYLPRHEFGKPAAPLDCETEPTVCPGFSTALPEVIEIARARLHWSKGSLRDFTRSPSEALLIGIEVLEGASNEAQSWALKNRKDG